MKKKDYATPFLAYSACFFQKISAFHKKTGVLLLAISLQFFSLANPINKNSVFITVANRNEIINCAQANLSIVGWDDYKGLDPNLSTLADIVVRGKVTNLNGDPLAGVSVTVKGSSAGTTTDSAGNYTISVTDAKAMLVFSYVGYASQEFQVGDKTTIDVIMINANTQLEQVIVVGYGTQRKRDLTGAISKISGEELAKQPVQTPTQALQGKVAGVQIIGSGQPNSLPQVRIRGTGSALSGVNPLYVVDGVLTDDIRNINNDDILSIEVLKDASAGIYGVRAANGVIIITTRKGKAGATTIRYDGNVGFREASNLVKMANRDQYIDYLATIAPTVNVNNPPLTYAGTTDWYDAVLRKALQTMHSISVSGGSDKGTFFFSGGYLVDNGIVLTNNFRRFTFRANNDIKIFKNLSFGTQLSYTRGEEKAVELGDTYRSVYRAAPIVPAKIGNQYGNTSAFGNVGNPLLGMEKRNQRIINNRFMGTAYLEYNPVSWLKLRSQFNADNVYSDDQTYLYSFASDTTTFLTAGGNQRRNNSQLSLTENRSLRWIADNTATFNKKFNQHNITFLAGTVTERFRSNFVSGSRINIPVDPNQWYLSLGNPDVSSSNNSGGDLQTRNSFVSRFSYDYSGKYLISASLRADGSSKFKERWGYFPTVGVGWVLSDESFMQQQKLFDFLKLRANWGRVGNDNIESNAYILTATVNVPYFFNNNLILGSVIQDIKDQNLMWESSEQLDIGFEFSLLNKRLSGEADYYTKTTKDALANRIIPAIFGDPDNQLLTNIASFRNSGVELSLNWAANISKLVNYSVGGNISYNKNELLGLNGGQALLGGAVGQQSFVTRTQDGEPVGSFYVLKAIGVFQNQAEIDASPVYGSRASVKPGDLKYQDISGPDGKPDGVIDLTYDRIFAGSYQPKVYFGFNVALTVSHFDLTADFYGNAGNKIYNGKRAFRFENTDNIEAAYANARWKPDRPSTTDPRLINSATPASTYFIESGSFVRLNNITLGYNFPSSLLKGIKMESLRVYVTAQNLFTAKKFSGFSPELIGGPLDSGIELNTYPTTRTFAFGVNLGF